MLPKSTVLAKVKGYPPWPAMVLDQAILPPHIISKRPRNAKNAIPVRFFSDDTYIWINPSDLKPLDVQAIDAYFESTKNKRRKDSMLENAYALAREPPEMEAFVQYGSHPPDEDEQEEEEPVYTPPRKKARVATVDLDGYDSDWGDELNEYDAASGDYIFDTKDEQERVFAATNAAQVQDRHNVYASQFKEVSAALVPILTEPECDPSALELVKKVAVIAREGPKSLFHKSPLLRAMIVCARRYREKKDPVADAVRALLAEMGLTVVQNTKEDMERLEKEKEQQEQEKEQEKEQKRANQEKESEGVQGKEESTTNGHIKEENGIENIKSPEVVGN